MRLLASASSNDAVFRLDADVSRCMPTSAAGGLRRRHRDIFQRRRDARALHRRAAAESADQGGRLAGHHQGRLQAPYPGLGHLPRLRLGLGQRDHHDPAGRLLHRVRPDDRARPDHRGARGGAAIYATTTRGLALLLESASTPTCSRSSRSKARASCSSTPRARCAASGRREHAGTQLPAGSQRRGEIPRSAEVPGRLPAGGRLRGRGLLAGLVPRLDGLLRPGDAAGVRHVQLQGLLRHLAGRRAGPRHAQLRPGRQLPFPRGLRRAAGAGDAGPHRVLLPGRILGRCEPARLRHQLRRRQHRRQRHRVGRGPGAAGGERRSLDRLLLLLGLGVDELHDRLRGAADEGLPRRQSDGGRAAVGSGNGQRRARAQHGRPQRHPRHRAGRGQRALHHRAHRRGCEWRDPARGVQRPRDDLQGREKGRGLRRRG